MAARGRGLITGAIAVALAAGAGAWALARTTSYARGVATFGVLVALVLIGAAVLARHVALAGLGVALVGFVFVITCVDRAVAVATAAVFGALLFGAVELAWLAIARRSLVDFDRAANWRRSADSVLSIVIGAGAACIVAVVGAEGRGGGPVLLVLAAAGAVGAAYLAHAAVRAAGPGAGEPALVEAVLDGDAADPADGPQRGHSDRRRAWPT